MDNLSVEEIRKIKFHPENNPDVISLLKRPDGNWRGFLFKNGKMVQTRAGSPQEALEALITAD
jgi:TATA-box binding protein (TBP) (component of TFIID and TFIIIB)